MALESGRQQFNFKRKHERLRYLVMFVDRSFVNSFQPPMSTRGLAGNHSYNFEDLKYIYTRVQIECIFVSDYLLEIPFSSLMLCFPIQELQIRGNTFGFREGNFGHPGALSAKCL